MYSMLHANLNVVTLVTAGFGPRPERFPVPSLPSHAAYVSQPCEDESIVLIEANGGEWYLGTTTAMAGSSQFFADIRRMVPDCKVPAEGLDERVYLLAKGMRDNTEQEYLAMDR